MARKYFCNLFSIILAFVIGVVACWATIPALHAHAEETLPATPAISVSSQTVTAGEYMYVTVNAENFTDVAGLEFSLYYDETVMSQSMCSQGWFLNENGATVSINTETPGEIKFNAVNADNGIQGSGTLLEIGFSISSEAEAGMYPLTLAVGSVYDLALAPVTVEKTNGVITIREAVNSVAQANFYAYTNDDVVSKGDTFTYTLYSQETCGLAGGNFNFTYDSNLLKLVDVTLGSELLSSNAIYSINDSNPGHVKISYADIEAITDSYGTDFFKLTFEVIADVSEYTTIGFSPNGLTSESLEELTCAGYNYRVSIQSLKDADPVLRMVPNNDLTAEGTFTVDVRLSAYSDVAAGDFNISYETWQLQCTKVEKQVPDGSGAYVEWKEDIGNGNISFSYLKMEPFVEEQTILTLTFQTVNNASGYVYMYASGSNVVDGDVNPVYLQYPSLSYLIPMNIGNYGFWLRENTVTYDGTEKKPTIVGDILTEGIDYTVSYENNVNAGTGNVVLTGIGNYGGKLVLPFTIQPAVLTVKADDKSKKYGEENPAFTTTITGFQGSDTQDTVLGTAVPSMYCSAETSSPVGNYPIVPSGLPSVQNYTYSYVSGTLIVAKESNSWTSDLIIPGWTYGDTAASPFATARFGTVKFTYYKDGACTNLLKDNPKDAGTYYVKATVAASDNYTGLTAVKAFTITPKSLTSSDISMTDVAEQAYTGKAIVPEIVVSDGTTVLKADDDYKLTISNNTNVGTATVTVEGMGNYSGTITKTFQIVAADIATKTATISTTTYEYDGTAKEPTVTIPGLKLGDDYTVTYTNNKNAGVATATISGKGNYTGSMNKTYRITQATLTVTAENKSKLYGEGNPAYTATITGFKGIDTQNSVLGTNVPTLTCSAAKQSAVGSYAIKASGLPALQNYTCVYVDGTLTIGAKALSADGVTVAPIANQPYTGEAIKPAVVITDGAVTLKEGTDYTVSYSNNTNVGIATVNITGSGNYTGTITKEFVIESTEFAGVEITLSQDVYTYDGTAKEPTVSVSGLVAGQDYIVSYKDNINVGTAVVVITGKGGYAGITTKEFVIRPADISDKNVVLSQTSYTYDGTYKEPAVTITGLMKDVDYTVSYANNKSVGTASVTVEGKGNYTGQKTVTFTIVTQFADLELGYYYITPVMWAVENGITSGTSATTFSPNDPCTRGQVVTFLHRAAGKPAPSTTTTSFTDLQPGWFYETAVLWAVENGITSGTSATTFSPDETCTRGQVVTFLWRAMGCPEPTTTTNPFTDLQSGYYYIDAVLWAVENGITSGTSATTFSPDDPCTRGQVVTFLYRTYN